MKKQLTLWFEYSLKNGKPSCWAIDDESGEEIVYCIRDSWEEAEKAVIRGAEKYFTRDHPPLSKTLEIEVPDPEPIELTEGMVEKKLNEIDDRALADEGDRNIVKAIMTMPEKK